MADRASGFWDNRADSYARQPVADEESYQTKLRVTREHLRPDMDVLEFGCGTGSTAILHAPHVRHLRAIDFSQRMIEIAREKAAAAGLANLDFERAVIDTLEVPDGTYDAILGMSILHLLRDRDAVIAKLFAMLKPGGVFISSTVCLGDTMKFFAFLGPIGERLGLLPHLDVMTSGELHGSVTRAGFAIVHDWQPGKGKAVFIVARKPE